MDGYMHYYMSDGYGYPYGGWIWMGFLWLIQLVIAFFIYRDAKNHGTIPVLWFILVIIPVIGWLFLVIYIILRLLDSGRLEEVAGDESAREILDRRYAAGDLTTDEYNAMKEELSR